MVSIQCCGEEVFQVEQLDKAETAARIIVNEEIDVAVRGQLVASSGAEKVHRGGPEFPYDLFVGA